jgi:hypothetical protein
MTTIRVTTQRSVVRVTQDDGTQVRVTNNAPTAIRISDLGLQGPPGPRLVEIVYQVSGSVPSDRTITGYIASAPITFISDDAVAICGIANSTDATFIIIDLDDNNIGTVDFMANQTTGTVTIDEITLLKNDGLKMLHPSNIDFMTDLVVTLPANRGN